MPSTEEFPGQGVEQAEFQDSVATSLLSDSDQAALRSEQDEPSQDSADSLNVDRDEYQLSPLDEVRAELQAEDTAQFLDEAAEREARETYEQQFAEALENYSELPPDEQADVCTQ